MPSCGANHRAKTRSTHSEGLANPPKPRRHSLSMASQATTSSQDERRAERRTENQPHLEVLPPGRNDTAETTLARRALSFSCHLSLNPQFTPDQFTRLHPLIKITKMVLPPSSSPPSSHPHPLSSGKQPALGSGRSSKTFRALARANVV